VTQAWTPPLQLTPATSDVEEALLWFEELRAMGVEGLVIKGEASTYRPGKRDWIKVKNRQTTEVIVGAVIGPIDAPQAVVAGLWRDDQCIIVGRTATLTPRQAHTLGALLKPAGRKRPWPDTIAAGHFGSSTAVPADQGETDARRRRRRRLSPACRRSLPSPIAIPEATPRADPR
jgi:ATP dependent DNA ligase domain